MKKTLSFEKDLTFQTMIGEITTISFEEDLKFVDKSNVEGNFYINGKYKMTEASTLLEDFSFSVPIDIAMIENYDLNTTKISVENFSYEVVDDDVLRCKINILIEGVEEVILEDEKKKVEILPLIEEKKEEKLIEEVQTDDERDCDGDSNKEEEIPVKEQAPVKEERQIKEEKKLPEESPKEEERKTIKVEKNEEKIDTEEAPSIKVNSLFSNLGEENDTFTTYSVYIMREGDTLEKVMDKYKIKKEDLEVYNDLSNIELNSKVIIPSTNNE